MSVKTALGSPRRIADSGQAGTVIGQRTQGASERRGHRVAGWSSATPFPRGLNHRHNAGADGIGQSIPGVDDSGQFGVTQRCALSLRWQARGGLT
jgi:hypothetical protein